MKTQNEVNEFYCDDFIVCWRVRYKIEGDDEECELLSLCKKDNKPDYETSKKEYQKWLRGKRYGAVPCKVKVIEFKYFE